MRTVSSAVLSPCIGICELDAAGYCAGCHRSGDEIAGWLGLHPQQRQQLMDHVLPAREGRHIARAAQAPLVWADTSELHTELWSESVTAIKSE
jgi:predicted Fe-S protein YdhL (DUF1289 family)